MCTVWNTWSARGWPLSAAEEAALVADLLLPAPEYTPVSGAGGRPIRSTRPAEALAAIARMVDQVEGVSPETVLQEADRDQVVWLVTALRCGAPLAHVEGLAPGVSRPGLLRAYALVERRRRAAVAAWGRLCRTPTARVLFETATTASLVLPAVVARVTAAAERSSELLPDLVAQFDVEVRATSRRAHAIEAVLASGRSPYPQVTGRALLDPTNPGWWDQSLYLPRRVGDLSPNRLRDLLGEEHG